MTSGNLTAEDIADYTVTFAEPHGSPRTVRAAYTATEPGWLLLKDHEHRTVAQINDRLVVMVERAISGAP